MSTILKALRRLEDDRDAQSPRPLREAVTSGGDESTGRSRTAWIVGIGLALAVGTGAGGVAFWTANRGASSDPPLPVAAVPDPVAPVAVSSGGSTARPERSERSLPTPATTSGPSRAKAQDGPSRLSPAALASQVERVERPPAEPRIADPDEKAAAEAAESQVIGSVTPLAPSEMPGRHKLASSTRVASVAAPRTRPLRSAPPAPPVKETSRPEPKATGAAEDAPPSDPWEVARASSTPEPAQPETRPEPQAATPSKPSEEDEGPVEIINIPADPAPTRSESIARARIEREAAPPPAPKPEPVVASTPEPEAGSGKTVVRAEVPGLRVEKTFWHPHAERRTALVEVDGDVEEIHEGDAVGPLVVSTIEPSAVVFDHEGVEIRRRIGE